MEVLLELVFWILVGLWKLIKYWCSEYSEQPQPHPLPPSPAAAPGFVRRFGRGTRCPVCSSSLECELVSCPKCATLHHEQCWDYVRGCALYGCRYVGRRRSG